MNRTGHSTNAVQQRYTSVAIALHWIIGLTILGLIAAGLFMTSLPKDDPLRATLTGLHMSTGLTILVLSVFRLIWRLTHRPPPPATPRPRWERLTAGTVHTAFYALMILIPLSGWVFTSVAPGAAPHQWYGLFPWPQLPAPPGDQAALIASRVRETHELLAFVLLGLAVVHIAAALRHQWLLRDRLLARMGLDIA